MALCFALGSTCFLVGPFPGYVDLVGPGADAATFFAGSILFTAGGALQTWLAAPGGMRPGPAAPRGGPRSSSPPARCSSTSRRPGRCTPRSPTRSTTGSSGARTRSGRSASSSRAPSPTARRRGTACGPLRGDPGWWEPLVNLLGCVFFGIAAVAGYVVPSSGSMLDLAAANWNTALGAACFLACALATLRTGRTAKAPRLRRLHAAGVDRRARRRAAPPPRPRAPMSPGRPAGPGEMTRISFPGGRGADWDEQLSYARRPPAP